MNMTEQVGNPKSEDAGAPAWVMTFADLMSLLMCFFVLLLSFSEMDLSKYKQIAGSMKEAFGVQKKVKVKETPRGINIIAREFSPGRPDPTPLSVIEQHTRDALKDFLATDKNKGNRPDDKELRQRDPYDEKRGQIDKEAENREQLEKAAEKIRKALKEKLDQGLVAVETTGGKIIIRIEEKASFRSGQAQLKADFGKILGHVAKILEKTPGHIMVAGHTDNLPISNSRFRSNWELSSSRAVSVVHELQKRSKLPSSRFSIEGRGETQPIAPNTSRSNRAKNRRVEIMLLQDNETKKAVGVDSEDRSKAGEISGDPALKQAQIPAEQQAQSDTDKKPSGSRGFEDQFHRLRQKLDNNPQIRFQWEQAQKKDSTE